MSQQIHRVVRVVHNLKGGGEANLGQRTLIVGPNGSGKSAIINAVELALTGKASDIAGRDVVAQGAALAALANGSGAWAEATLDDGATCRWEIQRNGSKVSRAKRVGPEGVLPLREVLAHLTGSADKARKFLLQHACEGIDNTQIVSKLDQDTLSRYQRLTDARLSPIDNLLAVTDLAAKKERDTKKHAAGAKETADAVGSGLGVAPDEAALAAAKLAREDAGASWRTAQATLEQARRAAPQDTLSPDERANKINGLRSWDLTAAGEGERLHAELRTLSGDTKAGHRRTLLDVVDLMDTAWTTGPCLACGQDFDRSSWKAHADHVRASVAAAAERHKASDTRRQEIKVRLAELKDTRTRVGARIEELVRGGAEGNPAGVDPEEAEIAATAARTAYEECSATYDRGVRADAAWERVRRAMTVQRDAERETRGWGVLSTECMALVSALVMDAVGVFRNRVQRFLPKEETFGIKFDKSAVRYGLLRDGEIHTALSGAEWARVSAALAAACTPSNAALSVLVPEDRAWDPKTLRGVLQGLNGYRGQVLVATTIKPYRGVPAGWTLIEVGE